MSQSNSSNIRNAERLYDKAKALSQHARPLDQRIAGIIIESANDAIREFGNTNQEKKIELKKMIAEAEDVLPPATIKELRKRAEGKALKKVHPKNKTLRNALYAIVALIIVVGGLFAFRKLFSGQTGVTRFDSSPTPHTTPTPQNQVENLAHDIDQGRKQLPVTPGANIPKEKPNYRRIRTKNGFTASCLNPPVRATLDYWPITYGDDVELCHIPPIVDARLSNGKYSRSKEDWERGITAHAGDEIYVVIYLNNGAADNLDGMKRLVISQRGSLKLHHWTWSMPQKKERPAMQYIGLDLGKTSSQICILTDDGELIERRIKTERAHLAKVCGQRPTSRILIEASTESEWVAGCLETLGHEVIVADPNFAPMYATRSKKIKTDKRDARALCEACRLGAYRKAHRTSAAQRHTRAQLSVRESLVGTRTKYIVLIKSLLSREGWRMRGGSSHTFGERVKTLPLPAALLEEIEPLLVLLETLNEQIAKADRKLEERVESDRAVKLLTSVPGVGKVTATAFVAAIDEVARFASAKEVRSYFGLVPREFSSGEKQLRGHISKAGSKRVRSLLVEVAWGIMCRKSEPLTEELRAWAMKIALRRGRQVAAVALARKLAGILYAMLRDGREFSPPRAKAGDGQMLVAA